MAATDEPADDGPSERPRESSERECPVISAYSTTETKTVFTEADNGDGWIATDHTVDVRQ